MNIRHATDTFIAMCQDVKRAKTPSELEKAKVKAEVYSNAIKDIAGLHIWGAMVMEADLEVGDDNTPVCCGIPLLFMPA